MGKPSQNYGVSPKPVCDVFQVNPFDTFDI